MIIMNTKTRISTIVKPLVIPVQPASNMSTGKIAAWAFLAVGITLIIVALVYYVKRAIASAKSQAEVDKLLAGQITVTGQPTTTTPTPGQTTTPSGTPTTPASTNSGPILNPPSSLPDWLVSLLWKTNAEMKNDATIHGMGNKCEITNNIMTIDNTQLKLYKQVYKEWYGRDVVKDIKKWLWCGGGIMDNLTGCPYKCEQAITKLNNV